MAVWSALKGKGVTLAVVLGAPHAVSSGWDDP